MIHPYLRASSLLDRAKEPVRTGATEFLRQLQVSFKDVTTEALVTTKVSLPCKDEIGPGRVVLCKSTSDRLLLVLDAAGVRLPRRDERINFLGSAREVSRAIESSLRGLRFDVMDVLPWAFLGGALWLLWPSKGVLNGYPAEQARSAVYAKDCDEAQRRLSMAWKALQQMEDRGDPQFMHEAKKVAKLARQVRENGCEVI